VTRPLDTRRCCGEVPCTCEARKAAARAKALAAAQAPRPLLHCRCDACGHRWSAAELHDCPACTGTARLLSQPPPCRHERLTGRPGDLGRLCLDCGALRVASP
jgi:hypothetical protein